MKKIGSLKCKFEKFERPTLGIREELKNIFKKLSESNDPELSVVINRKPQILYHQARILGYSIHATRVDEHNTRVWIAKKGK